MLKSIDVLIGFALVMLMASMAVTVLTQICTAMVNTRGIHLRNGLAGVIRQIDPRFSVADSKDVMDHVLTHPLIAEGDRLGSLVHRDEFTRILLELASGEGSNKLPESARAALADALFANGVTDPGAALSKIRDLALSLEISDPLLPANARHDLAILRATSSQFLAKINGWFDATIDRITARFAFTTRRVAFANALLVAVAIQLDSFALIDRLCADNALRSTLVQQATANASLPAASLQEIERLASPSLFSAPGNAVEWLKRWSWTRVPGVALSVLLLSLGAPFWFDALKNVLRLRSAITIKDDGQREQRQWPEAPPPGQCA